MTTTTTTRTNAPNVRHQAFAEHLAAGKSAKEAYLLAGYKATPRAAEVEASKLLRNPNVQAMIREAAAKASTGRILTAQQRREILTQIALGEIEQEIVTETTGTMGKGRSVQKRRPTSAERKAAIEHLDKLDGLVIDKTEHTGKGGEPLTAIVAAVPTEVLRDRLAELANRKPIKKG